MSHPVDNRILKVVRQYRLGARQGWRIEINLGTPLIFFDRHNGF